MQLNPNPPSIPPLKKGGGQNLEPPQRMGGGAPPLLAITLIALSLFHLPTQADEPTVPLEERPFATSLLFAFHSDPEINLHHLLYRWSRMQAMAAGTIQKWYPLPTLRPEDEQVLAALSPEEATLWEAALAHYREQVAGRNVLFDEGLIALRDALAGTGERGAVAEGDRETLAQLERVLPIYERHWWPRHDRENREWVAAVFPDVIRFERQISARIARAYGAEWPSPPNRVDLVPYASTTVAYTTGEPHTLIAAVDEESAMPWGLELLFHEPSHSNALEGRLHALIDAAYHDLDQEPPRNLWHILLFATAGKATQDVLAAAGREYQTYHQQFHVFTRREGDRKIWEVVQRRWYPAMDAGKTLEEVLPAIAAELSAGAE